MAKILCVLYPDPVTGYRDQPGRAHLVRPVLAVMLSGDQTREHLQPAAPQDQIMMALAKARTANLEDI